MSSVLQKANSMRRKRRSDEAGICCEIVISEHRKGSKSGLQPRKHLGTRFGFFGSRPPVAYQRLRNKVAEQSHHVRMEIVHRVHGCADLPFPSVRTKMQVGKQSYFEAIKSCRESLNFEIYVPDINLIRFNCPRITCEPQTRCAHH